MLRVLSLHGYVQMRNTPDGHRKTMSTCAMSWPLYGTHSDELILTIHTYMGP
jgi:hypothetical protein